MSRIEYQSGVRVVFCCRWTKSVCN